MNFRPVDPEGLASLAAVASSACCKWPLRSLFCRLIDLTAASFFGLTDLFPGLTAARFLSTADESGFLRC